MMPLSNLEIIGRYILVYYIGRNISLTKSSTIIWNFEIDHSQDTAICRAISKNTKTAWFSFALKTYSY